MFVTGSNGEAGTGVDAKELRKRRKFAKSSQACSPRKDLQSTVYLSECSRASLEFLYSRKRGTRLILFYLQFRDENEQESAKISGPWRPLRVKGGEL